MERAKSLYTLITLVFSSFTCLFVFFLLNNDNKIYVDMHKVRIITDTIRF